MNWERLIGLGIAAVLMIAGTWVKDALAQDGQQVQKTPRQSLESAGAPEGGWEPIAERQWARVLTVRGDRAIVSIMLTRSQEVFFKVIRPCGAGSETNILMWRAGSSTGYTLDCANKGAESLSPPFVEKIIGDLPPEVSYSLRWIRTHPKDGNSSTL